MTFDKELDFEKALIDVLTTKGWEKEIIYNPTEQDLINNWANILFNNNRDRDRLNDYPLTKGEMSQILEQINILKTPLKLNGFINGKTISITRDNPDDLEHLHKEISLKIYDRDEIAAGMSRYQIVEQPQFAGIDSIDYSRRGDLTLLINGMPVIHIELKKSGISVSEATHQIEKYAYEGKFTGLYSLVQIFVAMTPEETVYFANPGNNKFNSDYYFHWEDFNNELINNWKDIASTLLSIPMAHQLIGFYTVADDGDGTLKVMRSYQYYAANAISDKVSKTDFNEEHNLGGYIWHTTGSGKTMTSFKSAELIANSKDADKVIFLMDRIELGTQSLREYRGFADSASDVQGTENTDILKTKLKSDDPKDTLIVTSIQKMSRIKDDGFSGDDIEKINTKRLVFIVDECHRDVFGDMMITIKKTFPKAIMFGFTGTPLMGTGIKITSQVFGDELHRYSISDGIRDKNVLGFDPYMVCTYRDKDIREKIGLLKARVSSIDEIYGNPERESEFTKYAQSLPMEKDVFDEDWNIVGHGVENEVPRTQYETLGHHIAVVDNILDNFKLLSHNNKYSGIFATSSINEAINYYHIIKEKIKERNLDIKVTGLFDPSIDNNEGFEYKEDGLKEMIKDYNEMYDMNFSLPTYKKLKEDLTARFAHKKPYLMIEEKDKINLLIVVDQMLTGFDSKWINVLYLDKVLRGANIIQAFSRTNRICDKIDKPYGIIKYYRYPHTMKRYIEKAIAEYSGNKPFGIFVDKLDDNIKKLNAIYTEIEDLFESNGIENFATLPEDKIEKKKFAQLYKKFIEVYNSARLQGLSDNDFKVNSKIEDSNESNSSELKAVYKDESNLSEESILEDVKITFDPSDIEKIKNRGKDLDTESRGKGGAEISYGIETYITEYDEEKINTDYLNKKFEKYLKDLNQPEVTEEQLEKSLNDLHKAFAYLSIEQQKFANIFLHDIQSRNVELKPDKNFMDYIVEYQTKDKNEKIEDITNNFGLNKVLLNEMLRLNLKEKNIDEFGRFDRLKQSVNLDLAKEYFEKQEGIELNKIQVNIRVDKFLRNFILNF